MAKRFKEHGNLIYDAWSKYRTETIGTKNLLNYAEFEKRVKKYAKQKNTSIIDATNAIKDIWTDKAIRNRNIQGYRHDKRKDPMLVDKHGNYTPAAYKLFEEIKKSKDYELLHELQQLKVRYAGKSVKSIRASLLYQSYKDNKMARVALMLANAGYTLEAAAAAIGVGMLDINNPNNWKGSIFMLNGMQWEFIFEYDGSGYINTSHFEKK